MRILFRLCGGKRGCESDKFVIYVHDKKVAGRVIVLLDGGGYALLCSFFLSLPSIVRRDEVHEYCDSRFPLIFTA